MTDFEKNVLSELDKIETDIGKMKADIGEMKTDIKEINEDLKLTIEYANHNEAVINKLCRELKSRKSVS